MGNRFLNRRGSERVTITVKGSVGAGKTGVCAVIKAALLAHYGPHIEVVADELQADINMLGENGLQHPHPDHTKFIIQEELERR